MAKREQPRTGLTLIAAAKLLKAALLLVVAMGLHKLLKSDDAGEVLVGWAHAVRIDPENRIAHAMIAKVTGLSDGQMAALRLGTMLYALLYATEGVGLLVRLRWAEWMTVITTGLFLPVEVYEILHRFRWTRVAVLAANVAILWYLVGQLRGKHVMEMHRGRSAPPNVTPGPALTPPPPGVPKEGKSRA